MASKPSFLQRIKKKFQVFCLSLLGFFLATYFLIWFTVTNTAQPYLFSLNDLPQRQVAVILGAQVSSGQPSEALQGRLDAGIELYKQHKVDKLLMSGDGSSDHYDEVTPMHDYALKAGVADADIMVDPLGLRTYDSCSRLKTVYHIDDPILVSQAEHLKRAIYTCRNLGVSAIGYNYDTSPWYVDPPFYLREQAALVLAWLDVTILHPDPIKPNKAP